jgi:PncC family amidohydrolase
MLPTELTEPARAIAAALVERSETVAVAESSAGGLISAALLSVPGASAYYLGGAVIYTVEASKALLSARTERPKGMRGASEEFARYLAAAIAETLGTVWSVAETGASGPTGNRYGDPAGHAWVAAGGPGGTVTTEHVLTGSDDREANMVTFGATALRVLLTALRA